MQHTHLRHATSHPRPIGSLSKARGLEVGLLLVALILLAPIMYPAISRAASRIASLPGANVAAPSSEARSSSHELENVTHVGDDPGVFEKNADALAASGTSEAFRTLIQTLKQSEPESHRAIAVDLLTNASSSVVPVLFDALGDSDAGVRAGAAQVLGMRRQYSGINAFEMATHDPQKNVRSEAVKSLGEINAWQDLPRLELLQITDDNSNVRDSARLAVATIKNGIAREIGLLNSQLLDVAVTSSDPPRVYAATQSDLYSRHGSMWQEVSSLPDAPLALATGSDENLVYLATEGLGLYRSLDGGSNWEHVQFGLDTPTQLTATALVVDPGTHRIYAALAAPAAQAGKIDALGIFESSDQGKTWSPLPGSPFQTITTRLFLDPESPAYLFGLADDTPWRYQLPTESCGYCGDGK